MENVLHTSVELLTTIPMILIGQELGFLLQTKTHNRRFLKFYLYVKKVLGSSCSFEKHEEITEYVFFR